MDHEFRRQAENRRNLIVVLEKTLQSPVDGEKEEQGNPRQSSQPRTTRSQNVSMHGWPAPCEPALLNGLPS